MLRLDAENTRGCAHQCTKCGILYNCKDTDRCAASFLHGRCSICDAYLL